MDNNGLTVSFDGAGMKLDTGEDAEVICEAMREAGDNLEVLILQGNSFGIEAAERVGIQLAQHPNLTEAHFKDLFTTRGREQVPEALSHLLRGVSSSDARLKLLDLSDNAIGPIGAPSVLEFLQTNSALDIEKLYVNNCGWGPEGSTSLSMVIPCLTRLREFVCGRSRLENKGAKNMSASLSTIKGLEVLRLNQNGIGVEGLSELVKVLENNVDTIKLLDLSDNTIKPEGCQLLHEPLSKAKNLRSLLLSDALLQNQGFTIICDALSRSPALEELDCVNFEGNELKGHKIIDLIEVTFANCKEDFELDLLDNEFSREQRHRIKQLANQQYLVDSEDESDYYDEEGDDQDDCSEQNENGTDALDDGVLANTNSENSDGYIDLGADEFRERVEDFIKQAEAVPSDEANIRTIFMEMISVGRSPNVQSNFTAVQVLCEELGLIKCESTRKKKPIATGSVIYIGRNRNELPKQFREFFDCVIQNNDDLSCAKILFGHF